MHDFSSWLQQEVEAATEKMRSSRDRFGSVGRIMYSCTFIYCFNIHPNRKQLKKSKLPCLANVFAQLWSQHTHHQDSILASARIPTPFVSSELVQDMSWVIIHRGMWPRWNWIIWQFSQVAFWIAADPLSTGGIFKLLQESSHFSGCRCRGTCSFLMLAAWESSTAVQSLQLLLRGYSSERRSEDHSRSHCYTFHWGPTFCWNMLILI